MLMRSPAFGDPTAHPDRLQRIVRPGRPAREVWGEQDPRLAGLAWHLTFPCHSTVNPRPVPL